MLLLCYFSNLSAGLYDQGSKAPLLPFPLSAGLSDHGKLQPDTLTDRFRNPLLYPLSYGRMKWTAAAVPPLLLGEIGAEALEGQPRNSKSRRQLAHLVGG